MTLERRPGPTTRVRVDEVRPDQHSGDVRRTHEDRLATEEPLEIRIAEPSTPARRFGVTMRTPGHDFELAAGLLRTEGVIAEAADLTSVSYCTDRTLTRTQELNVVTVRLSVPARRTRGDTQMSATSACGVCGTDSLDAIEAMVADLPPLSPPTCSTRVLRALPDRLRTRQRIFDSTGGLHAAGLFAADGSVRVVREDVGRHNAVDKVIGHCLLSSLDPAGSLLCVSGRVGFEIVQKAVMARLAAVVAVGAPSSLAVELAARTGLTVAGFVRADRMVVYSGPREAG